MPDCHCCETFDPTVARRDLRRFRRRGPDGPTREILSAVQSRTLPPSPTLLDIGGGVGAIHHVLLEGNFSTATQVDASAAYLAAAKEESSRLHHAERVTFQFGDFHALAASIPPADVVTLHRVVCCDPDYPRMLGAAAAHARRIVAFSYPRPRWIARVGVAGANLIRRMLGHPLQVYLHPPEGMRAVLERAGLRPGWTGGTWIWAVELYERAG